ncbi:DEP domain-containing mTOR-interacting protein isoform X2 [Ctenopharyngodon idella]|uniref:DEP domain-containing mTOR-interacting protein isoform X2 n=1 Tax=Ctenopharyngodon idella TaxID=7959 RepID=UPI0022316D50|nr:DEP domain-containing mTOR-interacting protein isoform X2 [Ctenopharyngodon idella]
MELLGNIQSTMMTRHQKAEVMIAGEQLRLRLHDSKLIKDHRHHLRTYPNCFVAQELIDWLIAHKEVPNRETAVQLMQHLMDHDIIHHVCDKWPVFKDAKYLYRFRKDDGTFPFNIEVKIFMRGQRLYEYLITSKDSILQLRQEKGVAYERSFPGYMLIDWLLQNGEVESRRQGLDLCKALLEHGIIQHVSLKHHFFDSGLLYQFCINFRRRRRLSELLHEIENEEAGCITQHNQEDQADSPFTLRKTSPSESNSDFLSVQPADLNVPTNERHGSLTHQQHSSRGHPLTVSLTPALAVRINPTSVLKRHVTCEELLSPGAPYIKRVLTIIGDDLGWGFVVRGKSPCYVQAVDPGSPAAAAGVKVRQFVCRVNGRSVLHFDYPALSKLVMTGPRFVTLEVMQPLD